MEEWWAKGKLRREICAAFLFARFVEGQFLANWMRAWFQMPVNHNT